MGYTTEFIGKFNIDKNMPREFVEYINRFSSTRRMKRKTNSRTIRRMTGTTRNSPNL